MAAGAGYLSKGAAPQEVECDLLRLFRAALHCFDITNKCVKPDRTRKKQKAHLPVCLNVNAVIVYDHRAQRSMRSSEQLNLSPKTVNSYRYRMFSKLNIHGDVELTHLAIRHGLCIAETLSGSMKGSV